MKKLKGFFVALTLAHVLISLTACGADPADPLAFMSSPFSAVVDFTVDGETFRATVDSSPRDAEPPDGAGASEPLSGNLSDSMPDVTVTFLSGPLAGLSVGFVSGTDAGVSYDGLTVPMNPGRISGINDLAGIFFPDSDDYFSTAVTDEGTVITFSGGEPTEILIVDSLPKRVRATRNGRVIAAEVAEFRIR